MVPPQKDLPLEIFEHEQSRANVTGVTFKLVKLEAARLEDLHNFPPYMPHRLIRSLSCAFAN